MAWRVQSWFRESGRGTFASPHYGPFAFGPDENVDGIRDFEVGEALWVEIDMAMEPFVVKSVRPFRRRQPAETEWPPFAAVNGRWGELRVSWDGSDVRLWLGDCCEYCTPEPGRVRFSGVSAVAGVDLEDADFFDPQLRLASLGEIEEGGLAVPEGAKAFCIVSGYGSDPDSPHLYIVARHVEIDAPPQN